MREWGVLKELGLHLAWTGAEDPHRWDALTEAMPYPTRVGLIGGSTWVRPVVLELRERARGQGYVWHVDADRTFRHAPQAPLGGPPEWIHPSARQLIRRPEPWHARRFRYGTEQAMKAADALALAVLGEVGLPWIHTLPLVEAVYGALENDAGGPGNGKHTRRAISLGLALGEDRCDLRRMTEARRRTFLTWVNGEASDIRGRIAPSQRWHTFCWNCSSWQPREHFEPGTRSTRGCERRDMTPHLWRHLILPFVLPSGVGSGWRQCGDRVRVPELQRPTMEGEDRG